MLISPVTLQGLSQLRDPRERVPLSEHLAYMDALELIRAGRFGNGELKEISATEFFLIMSWMEQENSPRAIVEIKSQNSEPLIFSCHQCRMHSKESSGCEHQWASFILLWQVLSLPTDQIVNLELRQLSLEMKKWIETPAQLKSPKLSSEFADVELDSISLFLDEDPLLKGKPLVRFLKQDFRKYKSFVVRKDEEWFSPDLSKMPEVFRQKVIAYSERDFQDCFEQNRLSDLVRYNFSNGMQISAQALLRHPLQAQVPKDLLPQVKGSAPLFDQWPLLQTGGYLSAGLRDVESVIQALLSQVVTAQRRGQIEVYLQSPRLEGRALKLQSIEFDPSNELDWRVDFVERGKDLETDFKLVSFRKEPVHFFKSFAIEATEGVLIVHHWLQEFSQLQERLFEISEDFILKDGEMPSVFATREIQAKLVLKYLRTRRIPVQITGETHVLSPHQSQTEIRLLEDGSFFLQHDARVKDQKNLSRKGWTTRTQLFLETISQGLVFLLNVDLKDLVGSHRTTREWDMKLLKHLGILQFIFLESLSSHFEGFLTDGTPVDPENVFQALHGKIQTLLTAGPGHSFVRQTPLEQLCSKAVLSSFEEFVKATFRALKSSEAFYSEDGEVILEGIVEREFRLLFELLNRRAVISGGQVFQKTRTSFLSQITTDGKSFHFPKVGSSRVSLQETLESLQPLVPRGFKLYYKDQPLQELQEDEFHIEFVLKTDPEATEMNWFELNPHFFLQGKEVDPDNFVSLGGSGVIEHEGKIYLVPRSQMPSLRRLEDFWNRLQKGKKESSKKRREDRVYQLPRNQTLELLALRNSGVGLRGDDEWKKLCQFYDNLGNQTRELQISTELKETLKPYQALGVQWLQDLYQLRLGAILADDMGLGKTLQTLSFLDQLRTQKELGLVLVIVPSSLIFNWQQESMKFTANLPVTVFSNRNADEISRRIGQKQEMVVLTTYGLLTEHQQFLTQYNWNVVIFDEAQNLKNITTKRTSAARSLKAKFKVCLTGTPMENHYGEFYSLVDLIVPGSLGDLENFRKNFVTSEMITRAEMEDLKLKIKPLLLRRTKKEIQGQLPEKQETRVSLVFEERQMEIYRDIALSYNQKIKEALEDENEASVQLQMLTALLRLRQVCSDPAALPNIRYEKVPPKLETLLESLKEIVESGESALVFTQFLQTLEHATRLLTAAGIPVFVLHGAVPTKQRQKILSEFSENSGGAVLLMTLKTGGVGLNLTKASYVFHLEPWWNPSVENQATGRAHRLGQTRAVQVFKYIMHESLEEKIEQLKERKNFKFQVLLSDDENAEALSPKNSPGLSQKDFDYLIGNQK